MIGGMRRRVGEAGRHVPRGRRWLLRRWPAPLLALSWIAGACGTSTGPTPAESVTVSGTVTVDGVPASTGRVALSATGIAVPQVVGGPDLSALGSAQIEAGAYRLTATVGSPVFCQRMRLSVEVTDSAGLVLAAGSRELVGCGSHVVDVQLAGTTPVTGGT